MAASISLKQLEFPSISPPPTPGGKWRYDVFLSFRGEDTRHTFTSHIYRALRDAGINTFFDAVELPRGEEISYKLLQSIRSSRFAVVILSRSYAESKWCLQELEEIMKLKEISGGQVVLPVFYGVEPSHVRAQVGPFKEAFVGFERTFVPPEKVARWRAALTEAGNLSGLVVGEREDEAAIIEEIVRLIMVRLDAETYLHVASFPVGFDTRLAELPSPLSDGSCSSVYFLGVVGMAGVGKSSLAKAIYNKLFLHFKCGSFLANVSGKLEDSDYIVHLQEQLLVNTTKFKRADRRITNSDNGINIIKHRLRNKKVLVVLDDVSDLDQIQKLAGGRDWFGPGSRIIVTTRYPYLLKAIQYIDYVYEVKPLSEDESLQLFCSHAFRELSPPREEFRRTSNQVVSYCRGLPLALEVLGSSLCGKSTKYWENTLEQLKTIPDKHIQARLKISFDALGDRVQELFLDIACFFVGWDKDYVVMVLEACGLFAEKGIEDLINKCFVQVDDQNKLLMHDFVRDMGREIVRIQSPNDPGERKRLWHHEEVLAILRSNLGTRKVEGIALNSADSAVYACAEAFMEMKRLRVLQLNNLELHGEYKLISKELRLLYWHNFSSKFIPDNLYMEQLVAIDMQHNMLREVLQNNKVVLRNLKILNLSYSRLLTRTPDFSKLPNVERLILKHCTELVDIHPSIVHLHRLTLMNFKGCTKLMLEKFPDSIHTLKSLKSFCFSSLQRVSVKKCDLTCNSGLILNIPLQLDKACLPIPGEEDARIMPLFRLTTLKALKLMKVELEDNAIPADMSSLMSLEYLDLRGNVFISLPHSVRYLPKLKHLILDGCRKLEELPDMPPSLLCLSAVDCCSLRKMSMPHFDHETRLFLTNCFNLRAIYGLHRSNRRGSIHLERCKGLATKFREFLLKDWCGHGRSNVFLPGSDIPKWFHYQARCSSTLSIKIPPSWYGNLKDMTVCVIYSADGWDWDSSFPFPSVHIHPLNVSYSAATNERIDVRTDAGNMWVFHLSESFFLGRLESAKELTLDADFGVGWTVKGLGAYFPGKAGSNSIEVVEDRGSVLWNRDEGIEIRETEDRSQGMSGIPDIYFDCSNSIEVVEDRGSIFSLLMCCSVIFLVFWMLWRFSHSGEPTQICRSS